LGGVDAGAEGAALGFAELAGLEAEGAEVEAGTELVAAGTAPTAASDGFTEGAGPVDTGAGFVTVPGGPTADEGPGLAEGEAVAATGGGWLFSS
jgi:hypothetical protein